MTYTERVLDELKARYPEQTEFIQAATEIPAPASRPLRAPTGRSRFDRRLNKIQFWVARNQVKHPTVALS